VIQEATALWEKLRQSGTPKDAKAELVSKILALCEDRVADLAASHTASRIIQSCVKHGTEDDRITIQKQLLPRMVELSKNPYARFIMSKLIVTAPKSQLPGMVVDVFNVLAADVTKLRYLPDHRSRGICRWFC
jgi:pumilio family protein 6